MLVEVCDARLDERRGEHLDPSRGADGLGNLLGDRESPQRSRRLRLHLGGFEMRLGGRDKYFEPTRERNVLRDFVTHGQVAQRTRRASKHL